MPMLNILLTHVILAEYVFQNFVVLTHSPHPYAGSHYGNCEECHHEKLPEESIAYHEAVCIEKREVRNKEVIEHINGEGTLSHMCNESHYATIDGKEGRSGSLITEILHTTLPNYTVVLMQVSVLRHPTNKGKREGYKGRMAPQAL